MTTKTRPADLIQAVRQSDLPPSAVRLLLEVAGRTGYGRWPCMDSAAVLGESVRYSPTHVKRLLKRLEEAGWTRTDRAGGSLKSPWRSIYLAMPNA